MPSLKSRMKGNLTQKLFPEILFELWSSESSGLLTIRKDGIEKKLVFQKGQIAVAKDVYPEEIFLKFLQKRNLLNASSIRVYESYSAKNRCSLLQSLHQLSPLPFSQIWTLLEEFVTQDYLPLFDWSVGTYEFDAGQISHQKDILFLISTLDFILQGIRQMGNLDLLQTRLPGNKENIQILSPGYLEQLKLIPPEKYIWNLIKTEKALHNIYETSALGKKASQRVIFALFSLGLITFAQEKMSEASLPQYSQISSHKIWDAFNTKFSYIYKYISKELGPVAFNLMEKSLEEIRPHLSSLLRKIKFNSEGKIAMDSNLKTSLTYANGETKMNLLKDLNEILMAEVLAVKKNLGREQEAILINNLEKIGEVD